MGVEYKHFLIPADPTYVPQNEIFIKIDALLSKWNLKSDNPVVYNLTDGKNGIIYQELEAIQIGHGIAVEYPEVEGKQVSELAGPGYYKNASDDERYIQNITLIAGTDYRIHAGNEEVYIEIKKPPYENAKPVKPYCDFDEVLHYGLHAEAYSCSVNSIPPEVSVSVNDKNRIIGDQNFLGYWRAALVLDFGKDLPALGDKLYKLGNSNFLNELELAFGTSLIQIGEVY